MGNYVSKGASWVEVPDEANPPAGAVPTSAAELRRLDDGIAAAHSEINALGGTYYTKTEANGLFVPSNSRGAAGGVATLDAASKIPVAQIPDTVVGGMDYQGVWDASLNSPALATAGTGRTKGDYFKVSVAGTTNLSGITDWKVGDWAVFNGTGWDKIDNTDLVSSVNGFVGAVVLGAADVGATPAAHATAADPHTQYQQESEKGFAGGYAGLDAAAKVPVAQLPDTVVGGLDYQGTWNASTNTPALDGVGTGRQKGDYFKVSAAGATNLSGITDWQIGDWAVWNGASWDKVDNSEVAAATATETAPGLAEQATQAEVDGGSAGNLFVRPATHAAAHATPAKAAADPPGAYPTGISAFYLAAGTTGYPAAEGTVETHKVSAAQVLQFHYPRAGGAAPQVRYWDAGLAAPAWTAWASLGGAGGGATFAGRLPFAYPIGGGPDTVTTTNLGLAFGGGAIAVPVAVDAPLHLQSVSFWDTAAANARGPVELAVYREPDAGSAVGDLVPNAVGTLAGYTPTAASARTVPVASPPVLLAPGLYWVCLKNNNTANGLLIGGAAPGTLAAPAAQTKTLTTAAFGATLDLATGWAKINNVPGVRLNGRVLGQTAAF